MDQRSYQIRSKLAGSVGQEVGTVTKDKVGSQMAKIRQHRAPTGSNTKTKLRRSNTPRAKWSGEFIGVGQYEASHGRQEKFAGCDCESTYGPEGFGADPLNQQDMYDKCIAPGYWLYCTACDAARKVNGEWVSQHREKNEESTSTRTTTTTKTTTTTTTTTTLTTTTGQKNLKIR